MEIKDVYVYFSEQSPQNAGAPSKKGGKKEIHY